MTPKPLLPVLLLALLAGRAPAQPTDAARVAALVERFGLRSITGDAATGANLDVLEAAYSRFPAGSLADLEVVLLRGEDRMEVKKTDAAGNATIGTWEGLDAAGAPVDREDAMVEMVGGRVRHLIVGTLKFWGAVHEAAHHLTIYADPAFGREVLEALGYRYLPSLPIRRVLANQTPEQRAAYAIRPSGDPVTPRRDMDLAWWKPGAEENDRWFPTNYSRKKGTEHLAEVVTAHLARDLPNPTDPLRAEYDVSDHEALQALLTGRLGPGPASQAAALPDGGAQVSAPLGKALGAVSLFGF